MSPATKQHERVESWFCDLCAATGVQRGPAAADVLQWAEARKQNHARKSPACAEQNGTAGVRIVDAGVIPA